MATGPFAPYTNSLLEFQVSSGVLVSDTHGNQRPGLSTIQIEAMLKQNTRPQIERREGVDTSAIYLEGRLTGVVGAASGQELVMPRSITPDSLCSATWQGLTGRFWLEFTAPNPYLEALQIYLLTEIKGWFVPDSYAQSWEDAS